MVVARRPSSSRSHTSLGVADLADDVHRDLLNAEEPQGFLTRSVGTLGDPPVQLRIGPPTLDSESADRFEIRLRLGFDSLRFPPLDSWVPPE